MAGVDSRIATSLQMVVTASFPTTVNKEPGTLLAAVYTASCSSFPPLYTGESLTLFFQVG
jgi:hypothetical protein